MAHVRSDVDEKDATEALPASAFDFGADAAAAVPDKSNDSFRCPACQQRFESPKIFPHCYHSVCKRCVPHADSDDDHVTCIQCQRRCLPEELQDDRILSFLMKITGDAESRCANCEEEALLYCTTCEQPLCERCRESTHATRMFASHDIVEHEQHRICPAHDRKYVMYATDTNRLLCPLCFSVIDGSSKSRAVDLECAFVNTTDELEQSVSKLEHLRENVMECIEKIEVLLDETEQNGDTVKETIEGVFAKVADKLMEKRQDLLDSIDRQARDKVFLLQTQLTDLKAFSEVTKRDLEIGNVFSGTTTSVHEFLDLHKGLLQRVEAVFETASSNSFFLHPSSHIMCPYRNHIRRCIDEVLGPNLHSVTGSNFTGDFDQTTNGYQHGSLWLKSNSSSVSSADFTNGSGALAEKTATLSYLWQQRSQTVSPDPMEQMQCQQASPASASLGVAYADRFQTITRQTTALQSRLDNLKRVVQDVHRDLTHRRCCPPPEQMESVLSASAMLKVELDEQEQAVLDAEAGFQAAWQGVADHVAQSQRMYGARVETVRRMAGDMGRLLSIVRSLQPIIRSLKHMTERLHPIMQQQSKQRQEQAVMSNIFDKISSTTPNTTQRVKAIQTAEDLRLSSIACRTNPLDDNLVRTREALKPRPRRSSFTGGSTQNSPVKEKADLPALSSASMSAIEQ